MSTFTLHTLGCGSAKPSVRHNPSCSVLDIRGTLYMIDCGEGAQKMMQVLGLKFNRLRHIFITHMHGDHFLGLPGLLESLNLSGFAGTVTVHAFRQGIEFLQDYFRMFCRDMNYTIEFHEITPTSGVILENNAVKVTTIPLRHKIPATGFLFEEQPRKAHLIKEMVEYHQVPVRERQAIVEGADYERPDGIMVPNSILTRPADPSVRYAHISDTSFIPSLGERIGPVDLLLHEATYMEIDAKSAKERGHSTAKQAAMVAVQAGAKRLLLTHYSSRYRDENMLLDEAKEVFENAMLNYEGLKLGLD